MERDAITVALKITLLRSAENTKDPGSYPKPSSRDNNVEKGDQTDDVNQILADFDHNLESNYSSDEDNCVASVS